MPRIAIWIIAIILILAGAIVFMYGRLPDDWIYRIGSPRIPARPAQTQNWKVLRQWAADKQPAPQTRQGESYFRLSGRLVEHGSFGDGWRVRIEGTEEGFSYHIVSTLIGSEDNQFVPTKIGDTVTVDGWITRLSPAGTNRVDVDMQHPLVVKPDAGKR